MSAVVKLNPTRPVHTVLHASELTFRINGKALIDSISLNVNAGEVLALLGPNGAGKSTLLRVLAGDLRPSAGSVHLLSRELSTWRSIDLAQLRAVLPQQSTLAFSFTAREVVELGRFAHCAGRLRMQDHQIVADALAEVDMLHMAAHDYTTLSGGERARVQVARVFAQVWQAPEKQDMPPRLLLLDEPTAALDMRHQHELLAAARRRAHSYGMAVVAVLHDINLASRYADRILWLDGGRQVACGTPHEMIDADLIGQIYGVPVRVLAHPQHGWPVVVQ
jgi:iron complex transport system ATP-binding protein